MGVDCVFDEDDISGPLKIKRTNCDESTVFHETNQRFFPLRHIVPLNSQWLETKLKKKTIIKNNRKVIVNIEWSGSTIYYF